MLTESQLAERCNYIGASEAAACIGLDPYRQPLDVWLEKCGLMPAPDLSGKECVEAGNVFEPAIRGWASQRLGVPVDDWPRQAAQGEGGEGVSELIEPIDPTDAASAIRLIVQRWRECTQIANLAKKSTNQPLVEKTPGAVASLVEQIIEAAAYLSQGNDSDRESLAAAVAKVLCGQEGDLNT
jgi:hypothetical protein